MSDSVRPQRRQPTRLPRPWDSPGKNTGVGCHFLLQCMKVKSESEVAQSCPTLPRPHGLQPTRLLHPWDFPGKSTGVGCHCLLQEKLLCSNKNAGTVTCCVQLLSCVRIFVTLRTAACQASLSITNSWSLLKLMSIESVMPSSHFSLCCPLLLLPSIFPSIRVFSMSHFFASGGQSIRASALASVLPVNIQD